MNTLVIDASIAIKWVVEEDGTSEALVLRQKAKLIAPDLLVAECANIFWKKVQRGELLKAEALFAPLVCFRAPKSNCYPRGLYWNGASPWVRRHQKKVRLGNPATRVINDATTPFLTGIGTKRDRAVSASGP